MTVISSWIAPVAAGLDSIFREAILNRAPRVERTSHEARVAMLRETIEDTVEPWMFEETERFFPRYRLEAATTRVGRSRVRGEVLELRWRSEFTPIYTENAALFERLRRNSRACARIVRLDARAPRPTLILVHGFMGGAPDVEERFFPARELFEAGFDLAIVTLPGHGARKEGPRLARPSWPANGPRFTIDGYRQAIVDLRALVHHLRAEGAPSLGVIGMSLGGYTTALLATVESELRMAIPFIPLASIAQYMFDNGQLHGSREERAELRDLVETLFSPVSPMAREVRVPFEGRKVVAGKVDRITPLSHASRIGRHFGVDVDVFEGGHLLQWGKTRALLSAVERSRAAFHDEAA